MIRLYRANFNVGSMPVFYRLIGAGLFEFYNPYGRKWVLTNTMSPEIAKWACTLVGVNVKFKV